MPFALSLSSMLDLTVSHDAWASNGEDSNASATIHIRVFMTPPCGLALHRCCKCHGIRSLREVCVQRLSNSGARDTALMTNDENDPAVLIRPCRREYGFCHVSGRMRIATSRARSG